MSDKIILGVNLLCALLIITSALICIGVLLDSDKEYKI